MRLRGTALAATLIGALAVGSHAATTAADGALAKGDDPRLQRKTTFSADGARIADALARLSELTGVTMYAGIDKDDWMVYDRKVIVHVRDMELADLMSELALALRFGWRREGESGKWTYRLWQSTEQRAEEESLRTAEEAAQSKQLREKREQAIADLLKLSELPDAEVLKLKSGDPWRYILATEPLGKDLAEFVNSFPEARQGLVEGLEMALPVSTLSPSLQDTVRRIAVAYDSFTKSIGASEDHTSLLSGFERLQITINRGLLAGSQNAFTQGILGRITIGSAKESVEVPVLDPSSDMARALGRAIIAFKSGKSTEEVAKQLEADVAAAQSVRLANAASRDFGSDAGLRREVELFGRPSVDTLPPTLRVLAAKTGLNVVADHFLGQPLGIGGGSRAIGEQLDLIAVAYGCTWEKSGSTLRFRDKEWFRKRAWDVPKVWIDYWIARADANDGLQLQDFVQIANLRDEQIDHTIMLEPRLVNLGAGDASLNRQILRFYGLLTNDQRASLAANQIEVSSLSDDQWAALKKALATRGAAYAAASKGSQVVKLTQSDAGVVQYTFSYYPGAEEPPIVFRLTTGREVVFPQKKVVIPMPPGQ